MRGKILTPDPLVGTTLRCSFCGALETLNFVPERNARLHKDKLCFKCDFWSNLRARDQHDKNCVRIDGEHYVVGPPNELVKGHNGARFYIAFHDGRLVATDNLWHQGVIPQPWRTEMPDNGIFLEESEYRKRTETVQI